MDLTRVHQIIDWFAGSGLSAFERSGDGYRIRLERAGASVASAPSEVAPVASEPAAPPSGTTVEAPLYGILYLAPSPDQPAFVQPGQAVKAGETLCLIESMKVMNAIPAPRDGTVARIAAADGAEVEQGQALVVLE